MDDRDNSEFARVDERLRSIEQHLARIAGNSELINHQLQNLHRGAWPTRLFRSWRRQFSPRLWRAEQYRPRRLRISPRYALETAPDNPPPIAIVTPTLNQGRLITATIDSVLNQNYSSLTYHIQDGGSTDETIAVLKSYGDRIRWQSAPDSGQANAINLGFRRVSGDIMAYLNSDDTLLPGTLSYVARVFRENPSLDVIYGHRIFIDIGGSEIGRRVLPPHDPEALKWANYIPQETMFWRRRVWQMVGQMDESLRFAIDWDFALRAHTAGFSFERMPRFLACFRVHDAQKTASMGDIGAEEMKRIRRKHLGFLPSPHDINRALAPYLFQQMRFDWMYRLRLLRH